MLLLRLSVFLVMLMWTIDKFARPEHASSIYQDFYAIGGLSAGVIYLIGLIELAILIGFVLWFSQALNLWRGTDLSRGLDAVVVR